MLVLNISVRFHQDMSKRPAPSSAPSTPAATAAVPPTSAVPSEAPTIVDSDEEAATGPLSLQRRAPSVKKVIDAVMDCDALKPFLSLAAGSLHEGDLQLFSGEAAMEMWGHVADLLCDGVEKFTPMVEKDLSKKTAAFSKYKQKVINHVVPSKASSWLGVDMGGNTTICARSIHVTSLLGLITMHFIRYFLDMISSPSGDDLAPIHDQVDGCVADAILIDVGSLFPLALGQRVYFIVGFLCHAGATAASRRSDANKVGSCIAALANDFVLACDADGIDKIKRDLPPQLTGLVDTRNDSIGGLKYPNLRLYSVFAIVEKVFSSLTTSANFIKFGGTLINSVREALLQNESVLGLFSDLYTTEEEYDRATIRLAFSYYLQVFVNVRAKDLCFRFNSNIYKGSGEQGIRQTMAAVARDGDKRSKKFKSMIPDEPLVYPEGQYSAEEEVSALTRAAEDECDDGEKMCSEDHAVIPEDN